MKKRKQFRINLGDDTHDAHVFEFHTKGPRPPIPPMPPMPPHGPHIAHGPAQMFHFRSNESTARSVFQAVEDDMLKLLIGMPGIDKTTLKVRAKANRISISADLKEAYQGKLGTDTISHVLDLVEEVQPKEASAKYQDGVLRVTIPVANPGEDVEIEDE